MTLSTSFQLEFHTELLKFEVITFGRISQDMEVYNENHVYIHTKLNLFSQLYEDNILVLKKWKISLLFRCLISKKSKKYDTFIFTNAYLTCC